MSKDYLWVGGYPFNTPIVEEKIMAKKSNPACCDGCDCPCCKCSCPYCTLVVLIDQLKNAGVDATKAAEIAANFVQHQCC